MKSINYFHIIKSYFCFKDNKTKLIYICQSTIIEDMSIEKILERIYNLENIYISLNERKKSGVFKYICFQEKEYI